MTYSERLYLALAVWLIDLRPRDTVSESTAAHTTLEKRSASSATNRWLP